MAVKRLIVTVEMEDGTVHENVKTNLADQMLFAKTRQKHNWAGPTDDPMLWLNFMAYAALRRRGLFEGSWDEFCNAAGGVEAVEEDVNPTTAEA